MKVIWKLFLSTVKTFYRDKMTFFFTLIFPFTLVIIFGFVFGVGSSGEESKLSVGVLSSDKRLYDVVNSIEGVDAREFDSTESIRQAILQGKIDAGAIYNSEEMKLMLNFTTMQRDPLSRMLGDTITDRILKSDIKIDKIIDLKLTSIDPGRTVTTDLGYMIPGVVALTIFNGGMFSMISLFGDYRKRGILKRFGVTPLRPYQFILGMISGRFVVTISSATLVLMLSQLIFNVNFNINWFLYLISVSTSILGMMAFGILLSEVFTEPAVASEMGSLFMTVMMFFSGIYFPLEFLPGYLRKIGSILPLAYVAQSIRIATGVETGSSIFVLTVSLIMTMVFSVLVFVSGSKAFRSD